MIVDYAGSCHCGAVRIAFHSDKQPEDLGARSCQCGFCTKHNASWTSDPDGSVDITISGPVSRYRFGTGTADAIICANCGVATAVTCEIDGALYAVIRVDAFESSSEFLAHAAPIDFDGEDVSNRLKRRADSWTSATLEEATQHA